MCHICDHGTDTERRATLVDEIQANHATALIVTAPEPWVYTVGLTWNFDHPELISISPDPYG